MEKNLIVMSGDIQYPSLIGSWRAWRTRLSKPNFDLVNVPYDEDHVCKICHGYGMVNDQNFGSIYCICSLKYYQNKFKTAKANIESSYEPKFLDNLEVWGEVESRKSIRQLKKNVQSWMNTVDKWLILVGNNGVGKSHILQSIATYFDPWSLYLSVPDIESLVFEYVKGDDDKNLQELLELISHFPILILDDIGADYGSEFQKSSLRKIVDYRYRFYSQCPTIFATNLGPTELSVYDRRIGDRVFDLKQNQVETIHSVLSYRKTGGVVCPKTL